MTWDHGQKIFPLPRGDSVLAFAGDTFYAYPLILQTLRYVEDYDRAESRALPLEDMKGHLERVPDPDASGSPRPPGHVL